jgi:predicted ferric reductase
MAIIQCAECQHDISDKAQHCVGCGYPLLKTSTTSAENNSPWAAVVKSKTPINIFSLAMMTCASILGVSAASIDNDYDLMAFTYTLHVFLATIGMFFVTLLFNRNGIYHPEDIAKANREGFDVNQQDRPLIAAVLIMVMITAYALYQFFKV